MEFTINFNLSGAVSAQIKCDEFSTTEDIAVAFCEALTLLGKSVSIHFSDDEVTLVIPKDRDLWGE